MRRPLLGVAAMMALGASLDADLPRRAMVTLLTLALVLVVAAWMRPGSALAVPALGCAAATVMVVAVAAERAAYERAPLLRWYRAQAEGEARRVRLHGTLVGDPTSMRDVWLVVVDVRTLEADGRLLEAPGRARIYVDGTAERPTLVAGQRVAVWARLSAIRGLGNSAGFDPAAQARRRGIHLTGSCKSALLVEPEGGLPRGPLGVLARARQWARARLDRFLPAGRGAGVVKAMVIGDRSDIDPDVNDALRIAGTYHVLAISGAQVALIAVLLLWLTKRVRLSGWPELLVVSAALASYSLFVGGDPPVTRAAIMASVMLLGRVLGLDRDPANLLGFAAAILLALQPQAIGEVSLQLTCAATLAILLLTPVLMRPLMRLPRFLGLSLAGSLAAQIGVTPLLLLHFHRFAPAALVLNLVAVPLASAALLIGFGVVVAPLGLGVPLAWLADCAARLLVASGEWTLGIRWLDIQLPEPPLLAILVYYVFALLLSRGQHLGRDLVLCAGSMIALLTLPLSPHADGRLHLTVLDVGDGDGLVLRSPRGRFLVLDAPLGARGADMGERVVAPFLWSEGVRRIDRVIVSHFHSDHAGGIPALLRAFRVDGLWEGPAAPGDASYEALAAAVRDRSVLRLATARGGAFDWDGARVSVLWPATQGSAHSASMNDQSLVVRLDYGEIGLLLAGDIERAAEERIGIGSAAVIKVPHHGSRTSSTWPFLRRVAPRLAIVSVGRRNRERLPHPEILDRYRALGVRLYRTDEDGVVTVSTDGRRLWVRTFGGGVEELIAGEWGSDGPISFANGDAL